MLIGLRLWKRGRVVYYHTSVVIGVMYAIRWGRWLYGATLLYICWEMI